MDRDASNRNALLSRDFEDFSLSAVFVNQKFLPKPAHYLAAKLENEISRSVIVQKYWKWTHIQRLSDRKMHYNALIWSLALFQCEVVVKVIKNNLPCFLTSDWRPNFKSFFVQLCLINYLELYLESLC